MPKMTGAQYEKKVKEYLRNHLDHIVIHRLRTNQPLTETDLQGLETTLAEIGEEDGQTLLRRASGPQRGTVARAFRPEHGGNGPHRGAGRRSPAFSADRSLTPPQIRFVEMVIDQLTARGVMDASALYEPPFSNLHAGGPDELFAGKDNVITGIFDALKSTQPRITASAG